MNRRYEIDWIRNISILMLFVYHTSAIFCMFGDFYIVSEEKNIVANLFIVLMFVWYMPTLFFLAGASTYFASKKRTFKEYVVERVKKLFIPLVFGIVALVPPQTYIARVWRGEKDLNYLEHLKYFFTNLTDFTGYDGAFTPAHLWFILYLFVVSLIGGFIVFKFLGNSRVDKVKLFIKSILFNKFAYFILVLFGIISDFFPSIMGKSIVGCLMVFMMGYFVYSSSEILDLITKKRFKSLMLIVVGALVGVVYIFAIRDNISSSIFVWILDSVFKNIVLVSAIATIIGFSSVYLTKSNSLLRYLNKSAFAVYIIHQPVLLIIAFYIMPVVSSQLLCMAIIIFTSFIMSFLIFHLIKSLKFLNIFFGLK